MYCPPYIYFNVKFIYFNHFSNQAQLNHEKNNNIYPNECRLNNVYIRPTIHNLMYITNSYHCLVTCAINGPYKAFLR